VTVGRRGGPEAALASSRGPARTEAERRSSELRAEAGRSCAAACSLVGRRRRGRGCLLCQKKGGAWPATRWGEKGEAAQLRAPAARQGEKGAAGGARRRSCVRRRRRLRAGAVDARAEHEMSAAQAGVWPVGACVVCGQKQRRKEATAIEGKGK
jgi:hypothetical protein